MSGQRLDKWLVVARFAKTREKAAALIESGQAKANGQRVEKPSHLVRPGDVLILPRGRDLALIKVVALAPRRGSAVQARLLYDDLEQAP